MRPVDEEAELTSGRGAAGSGAPDEMTLAQDLRRLLEGAYIDIDTCG